MKPLTAAAVAKYRPAGKRRIVRDAGARSLFLVIAPSGAKSWQMRFRTPGGRIGKLTLGPVDLSGRELTGDPQVGQPLSLAGARQLAASVHRERALGRDPVADAKTRKHRQRAEIEQRAAGTFATAVRKFIDEHAKRKTRRWRETARVLGLTYPKGGGAPNENKGSLLQRWAERDVREIDGLHDVFAATEEARKTAIPGIEARNGSVSEARARALFSALSSLFGWLLDKRMVGANPCTGLKRPAAPDARDRVLTAGEIKCFWEACATVDHQLPNTAQPYGAVFKLLLLTGARLSEVAGMRRSELSDDGATWNIPGSRTKNHRAHVVPLPPLAREIIASVPATASDLVFTYTGSTPISGWSKCKRRLDAAMLAAAKKERSTDAVIAPWRLHDLRRTAVTGMAELGIRADVIELAVNHVSGTRAGIAGVYHRSELLPERCAALERWSQHVTGLASGEQDKVVPIKKGWRRS